MNEIRQKFEEVARPILNGGITRAPVANLFDRNPHYPDEYKFRDVQVAWGTYQAAWRAAYEAGEIAMKEKAAERATEFYLAKGDALDIARAIRALPLSGAEEKEGIL